MPYTRETNHIKLVGLQDRRRKLTDEQKAEIIRLRDEGWSLMKLANIKRAERKIKMKQTKVYPHELKAMGFVAARWREADQSKLDKNSFVQMFLSPAVANADCGWYGVEYVPYDNGEEYVFFVDSHDRLSRGICVTADSKQAIATAVFDNID